MPVLREGLTRLRVNEDRLLVSENGEFVGVVASPKHHVLDPGRNAEGPW